MSLLTRPTVLRVGRIHFLNTLPFFYSWKVTGAGDGIRFVNGSPQEINEKMSKGEMEIGLTSSLAYALYPERLLVLPGLCIGAYRRSKSVTLYSREPIETLNGKKIALSAKSLSASALLRILLALRWRFQNEFEISHASPELMLQQHRSCLLIGDEALFFRPQDVFSYDLSEMWWEWTGFPFCFALWTVRKSFYERFPAQVERVYEILSGGLTRNLEHLEKLVDGTELPPGQGPVVLEYLKSLEYRLTDKVQEGLHLFFRYAQKIGLVPEAQPLEFCPVSLSRDFTSEGGERRHETG